MTRTWPLTRGGAEVHDGKALAASGDIIPRGGELLIRLDPVTAPRRTHALAALCDRLNRARARCPGTSLILRYQVKPHTGLA